MGCDIHMWAETRSGHDAPWTLVPGDPEEIAKDIAKINGYRTPKDSPELSTEWDHEISTVPMRTARIYTGRNYALFGILAGVRAYKMPHQFPVKGVPADASPEYKAAVADWDADGHSHNYITLKELVEWPHWHAVAAADTDYGDPVFKILWRQFINRVKAMPDEECEKFLAQNKEPSPPKIQMSSAGYAQSFYRDTIPKLFELAGDGALENVRIVFFFDN